MYKPIILKNLTTVVKLLFLLNTIIVYLPSKRLPDEQYRLSIARCIIRYSNIFQDIEY